MKKFFFMDKGPCLYQLELLIRQIIFQQPLIFYADNGFEVTIFNMKMGRSMVFKKHLNDDTKKTTDFRHGQK